MSDIRYVDEEKEMGVSGRILFGGKTLSGVDAVQSGWHRDLHTLNAALPQNEVNNSWPAAFGDFDAGRGMRIVCLTDEAALKAEGGRGPDADGVEGLDHCVGGYGEQCFSGETFIASVRKVGADGRVERRSTIEFVPEDGPGGSPIKVIQHYGYGDGDPPNDACAAVERLEAAFRQGQVGFAAEALETQSMSDFIDGYDWRDPAFMRQAFDAWRRHLPKEIAHGGLEALIRFVASHEGVSPDKALGLMADEEPSHGPGPR